MTEIALQNSHGGTIIATARTLGVRVDELIDMSSNLSPLGMVPGLAPFLASQLAELGYLPEIDNMGVQQAFARCFGCEAREVLAGNGTTDFIFALPQLAGCKRAVIVQPTYNDYGQACQRYGLDTYHFFLEEQDDFSLDLQELALHLRAGDLVFICNPNNPTGQLLASAQLHDFVARHEQITFVVDESYLPFTREPSLVSMPRLANLFYSLFFFENLWYSGLASWLLVAMEGLLQPFRQQIRPWSVNRLAQLAGEYLFSQADSYRDRVLDYLAREKVHFVAALQAHGPIRVVPGVTNFLLCAFTTSHFDAQWLQAEMLKAHIMVRNCANFNGLDTTYFRISLQKPEENIIFLNHLAKIMA